MWLPACGVSRSAPAFFDVTAGEKSASGIGEHHPSTNHELFVVLPDQQQEGGSYPVQIGSFFGLPVDTRSSLVCWVPEGQV